MKSTNQAETILNTMAKSVVETGKPVMRINLNVHCSLLPVAFSLFGARYDVDAEHECVSIHVPRLLNNQNQN